MGANDKREAAFHPNAGIAPLRKHVPYSSVEMELSAEHPWFDEIWAAAGNVSVQQFRHERVLRRNSADIYPPISFEARLGSTTAWFVLDWNAGINADYNGRHTAGFSINVRFHTGIKRTDGTVTRGWYDDDGQFAIIHADPEQVDFTQVSTGCSDPNCTHIYHTEKD